MVEYLDIVNDDNKVIGNTSKNEVYEKKLNHRIVHILVINPKTKEIYWQKRSEYKSFLPGFYCTSAGGHVQSGESYFEAAKRELKEEIGLEVPIINAGEIIFESENHKRFISIYVAYAENGFNFEDGEVADGDFLSFEKADELILIGKKIHPQLKVCHKWLQSNPQYFLD
jgi:8-oxo-dGTP pyrophosphatase MutT (NUDIX family)